MIEVILDASGSMNGKLSGGEAKIAAAKQAVGELVKKLPDGTMLGFRAYGHQSPREKHDCQDTQFLVPFGPLSKNRSIIDAQAKGLTARGYTPITTVITKGAEDFPGSFQGERVIVLVSDGKETCEGDPCAAAQALAKKNVKLVIHTVGFGVDEAARSQLECVARVTGGRYFPAESTAELIQVLGKAVETSRTAKVEKKGPGRLEIKGADLAGHQITRADTGEKVGSLGHTQSSLELPAGIYNVTIGKAVWKSVEVRAGEKTTLTPGFLTVEHAWISGHNVTEAETGAVHGQVSSLQNNLALMPGDYEVSFGKAVWPVRIKAGEKKTLHPGTVQVVKADYRGHKIRNKKGEELGSVSNTQDWMPLPPGEYTIELKGKAVPFTLQEGEEKKFQS
ncbi:MAG: VWA domain-containing protein [Deltaproteobacteria bacterium]|nr:VWA domain-containing protein [Deltaproteobacteria bacterium]